MTQRRRPPRAGKRGPQSIGDLVKEQVPTRRQLRLLDANRRIREKQAKAITFQHTVLCQTGLPYRNPGDDVRVWEREQGRAALSIEAGRARHPKDGWIDVGLPFGPKARLVLLHLNQSALRTQSPEIDVGDSMTAYLGKELGLDTSGRNIRVIKDQLQRLSTSTIRLAVDLSPEHSLQLNSQVVGGFDLWFPKDERQRVFWQSHVRLSDDYFNSLMAHAVPLREAAIAALSHNAMALDVYAWLAQRVHRIPRDKPQFIPWAGLWEQFGQGYGRIDNFKRVFRKAFRQVLKVYPDLRGRWQEPKGLWLENSPPPVLPREAATQLGS